MRWFIILIALFSLLALPAPGEARIETFADVTVTGSVTTVRAANANRAALNCTNTSASVHVRWGDSNISATRGEQLRATLSIEIKDTSAISMISEGADVTVSCTEELTR